ncbi:GatB/YqeY domain-containing protein [Patescibacteria group bacterium]|nr:GatB/YqeY domain-containing protein [Patescibacteria group bacterium]
MLYTQLKDEAREALKSKDELTLLVLRGLISDCTNDLVAKKRKPSDDMTDEEVLVVIKRAAKQRKDSIEQFTKGGRKDLVEKEEKELKILETYLPASMSKEEIEKVAKVCKEELGVMDKSEMGKLMGAVMKKTKGKADGKDVKKAVESLF